MSDPNKGRILLSVTGFNPRRWHELLSVRREVVLEPAGEADPSIEYAVVWKQKPNVLSRLPNLKAVFSIGAGVDHLFADPGLPEVPIVRVVADNLTQYMTEYVCWRVLDHHRQGRLYRDQQKRKVWHEPPQPPAGAVSVGIMGLGNLGRAAAKVLLALGYTVKGWSRTGTRIDGVETFGGAGELDAFLAGTDILVVLLPLTPETRGILNAETLSALPRGACVVHAGRGAHLDTDALRAALDAGQISSVMLDVTNPEPLPSDHWMWLDPRVIVTPHVAAQTDATEGARHALSVMRALRDGTPVPGLVDRARGY